MDVYGIEYESMLLEGEAYGLKYLSNIISFYAKLKLFFLKIFIVIDNLISYYDKSGELIEPDVLTIKLA